MNGKFRAGSCNRSDSIHQTDDSKTIWMASIQQDGTKILAYLIDRRFSHFGLIFWHTIILLTEVVLHSGIVVNLVTMYLYVTLETWVDMHFFTLHPWRSAWQWGNFSEQNFRALQPVVDCRLVHVGGNSLPATNPWI
jgi:hypothetical protein